MSQEPRRGDFARKKGEVILREHEFDGIQEYDQKLPNWWLFTFYGAIVWFVIHWVVYYNTTALTTDHQRVEAGLAAVQAVRTAELEATLANLDDGVLANQWAQDPAIVVSGEAVYATHCVACHAADLSATMTIGESVIPLPGLPLDDHEWKYGGLPMDLFKLINEGSPADSDGYNGAKMQVFGQILTPKEIAEVVAYIISKVPEDFEGIE